MATIRYGARAAGAAAQPRGRGDDREDLVDRGHRVWETDLDVIRAVLPPPLEPSEPLARIRFATVDMGTGIPVFGAGWFGVRARHGRVEGEYALFMPMTTEQATVGGRETFGEPKKIGAVSIDVDGDRHPRPLRAHGLPARRGARHARRRRSTSRRATRSTSTSSAARRPTARASTPSPRSCTCRRHEEARDGRAIDGTLDARSSRRSTRSPTSRSAASCRCSSRRSRPRRRARWSSACPADWLLPYVHQRYDDLSVLGKKG